MSHIAAHIPYLRRYARALTGDQKTGDALAARALEAALTHSESAESNASARVSLFRAFQSIWEAADVPSEVGAEGEDVGAEKHIQRLAPRIREAVLLHDMEDLSVEEVAQIMQVEEDAARALIEEGRAALMDLSRGSVLIIEDEALIAMDLRGIVEDAGHEIYGLAHTHAEALEIAHDTAPDLILADIELADESSGIDAVGDLRARYGDVPVIYITGVPERLLTGENSEPSFLIPKPFNPRQVLSAISQAVFFSSTEGIS